MHVDTSLYAGEEPTTLHKTSIEVVFLMKNLFKSDEPVLNHVPAVFGIIEIAAQMSSSVTSVFRTGAG